MANTHSLDLESSSSQYASIADASQTGLDLSTALTFEMWIKPESWQAANITYLLSKAVTFNNDAAFQFYYDLQGGGNELYLTVTDGSNNDGLHVTKSLATGMWHHVAVTWQGSNKNCKFYVNGVQVGSTQIGSNVASIANSGNPFIVGQKNSSGYFDGLINDVRVWNVVRTATEIKNSFQGQLVGNESGLVAYWKFNNNYNDETSNNNDLTASGSPTFSTTVPFTGALDVSTTTALTTGLVAYYSLEEASGTRVDAHNSHDLTDVNTVGQATGIRGNGADFETDNSEYLYNTSTDFHLTGSNPFTVSLWVKMETTGSVQQIFIANKKSNDSVGDCFRMYYREGTTNTLHCQTWASSGSFLSIDSGITPNVGQWYHFVFVKAASNDWKVYVDGVLAASSTSNRSNTSSNLNGISIGAEDQGSSGVSGYADAVLDEIGIWNVALTDVDIRDLYGNGAGIPYSGSNNYTQGLDETIALVDTKVLIGGKTLAEVVTVVDTLARSIERTFSEVATMVDTIATNPVYAKVFDEALALVDTNETKITGKTLFEAVAMVDAALRSVEKTVVEVATIEDTQTVAHYFTEDFIEALALVDTIVKQVGKDVAEIITLLDSASANSIFYRTFDDAVALAETISKMANKVVVDSLTVVDTFSRVGTFGRTLSETAALVERFQGLINGQNIAWFRRYTEQAGTWIKKYLDIP